MNRRLIGASLAALILFTGLVVPPAGATFQKEWAFLLPGWNRTSSPAIADVDGDGVNEVVFGHQDGKVRVYRGNGTLLWSSPAVPGIGAGCRAQTTATAVDSSPAVADIDDDGTPEVIVGVGSTWVPNQNGSVVVFDGSTGAVEWRWSGGGDEDAIPANTGSPDGWCDGVYSTPAVGDVDGDGHLDVVFAGWDFRIWAVDRNGVALPGFPFNNDDTVWSSPALVDVDADGRAEIFIGGDSTPGGYFDHLGGVFRALDWSNGTVVELWNQTPNEVIHSSPAIADINGDGRIEVVVGSGDNWRTVCSAGHPSCTSTSGTDHVRLHAWHADDGSVVPGFPVSFGDTVMGSPALGDVDSDGLPEIVIGSYDRSVRAVNGDGSALWSVVPTFDHLGSGRVTGSPVIADLDGDGDQDVAIGTELGLAVLNGRTGASLEAGLAWPDKMSFAWSHEAAPAVGVLGGERRIVITGFSTPGGNTRVSSHALPDSDTTDAWPMFHHSARRTGATAESWCDLVGATGAFCDVPEGLYFSRAVEWMADVDITTGVAPGLFGPHQVLSRAQMITFLWRQAGEPGGHPPSAFVDVEPGSYYEAAVRWAAATGVTTGTAPDRFSPHSDVTRAQLVTLLWRRAGAPAAPDSGFVDVPAGRYYTTAIGWAKADDITTGTSATTFSPDDPVTRAQAAALLHREAGSP
jgi:hypothetical protein